MSNTNTVSNIHVRYKRFQKEQRDIWESFCLIDFYSPKIHELVKNDILPTLTIDTIWGSEASTISKNDTYGAISSLSRKGNYRKTLLEAVLFFEDYISDLIKTVYLDYPMKLSSPKSSENQENNTKLLTVILESADKQEMIDKIAEEKIRGIFYGNPVSVFENDKAKLEFGSYFKDNCQSELKQFKLILAMRNIVAHNNGKIDRKYIREADSNAQLGSKIIIEREFLRKAIYTLSLLAAQSTRLVVEKIYKETPQGRLGRAIHQFEKNS